MKKIRDFKEEKHTCFFSNTWSTISDYTWKKKHLWVEQEANITINWRNKNRTDLESENESRIQKQKWIWSVYRRCSRVLCFFVLSRRWVVKREGEIKESKNLCAKNITPINKSVPLQRWERLKATERWKIVEERI
jgi:hypothetical protein